MLVGVGWFKSHSDFDLCRVTGTKEGKTCSMSFSSYGGVGEILVWGETLVKEFGVGMG